MNLHAASGISLCLTAGGRPDLLDRTLTTLLSHNKIFFSDFLITNDAGDEETNRIVLKHLPDAKLICHPKQHGHHASIDEMYDQVLTPYIFHCEDDWEFDPIAFVPRCLEILTRDDILSQVAVRQSSCFDRSKVVFENQIVVETAALSYLKYKRLLQKDWGHFTFNPSLLRKELWVRVGPFKKYFNERDINDKVRSLGLTTGRVVPGVCWHIGDERHIKDTVRKRDTRAKLRRTYRKLLKLVST